MNLNNSILFELGFDEDRVNNICKIITDLLNARCYEVRAKYVGAKKKKGVRGAVYRHAEEHNAYYSLERSKSIFYDDDDLQIVLLFCEKSSANKFRTFLSQWYLNNPMVVKYGDVVVNDTKVLFVCHDSMECVELAHYTATESDSPVQTLEELRTVPTSDSAEVSALSFSTPVAQFQSIERPELFLYRHPVKCRIKSECGV